jgi:hypothetical protein
VGHEHNADVVLASRLTVVRWHMPTLCQAPGGWGCASIGVYTAATAVCLYTWTWLTCRQTVLLSSFLTPDMSALMCGPLAANHEGRVRVKPQPPGVLGMVVPQVGYNTEFKQLVVMRRMVVRYDVRIGCECG